jgi:hypothetical protein
LADTVDRVVTGQADESADPAPPLLAQWAAVLLLVILTWILPCVWLIVARTPAGLAFTLVSLGATLAWVTLSVVWLRRFWFVRLLSRSACTVLGASALLWLVALYVLPSSEDAIGSFAALLLLIGLAGGVGLAGLVRAWWHPVDGVVALALVVAFGAVLWTSTDALASFGRRELIRVYASAYRRQAADLIEHPPKPRYASVGDRLVLHDRSGRRTVVVWAQSDGLPSKLYGLAYDPDGALRRRSEQVSDGTNMMSGLLCDRIEGPWFHCQIS